MSPRMPRFRRARWAKGVRVTCDCVSQQRGAVPARRRRLSRGTGPAPCTCHRARPQKGHMLSRRKSSYQDAPRLHFAQGPTQRIAGPVPKRGATEQRMARGSQSRPPRPFQQHSPDPGQAPLPQGRTLHGPAGMGRRRPSSASPRTAGGAQGRVASGGERKSQRGAPGTKEEMAEDSGSRVRSTKD